MTNAPPLILIGGYGFLGLAYAARAERAGREVHKVGRRALANPGARDWQWDDRPALAAAMAGRAPQIIDFAYATVPSTSFGDPVGDFTSNLGAVIRHLDFAKASGASAYLLISSGGTVYGDSAQLPLTEESPTHPISPYGITKLAAENYALMYRRLGVPVMIARPSNIYGPGQQARHGQGMVAAAFAGALAGRPLTLFGDGAQLRDYLYVEDFCLALDAILNRGELGAIYNVGSGQGVRADDLLTMIGAIVARDGRQLVVEQGEARPFDVDANVLDARRIEASTGWRATTGLAEGLERAWSWALGQ
jgi:UDP-glucose 4-epimerase